MGSCLSRKKKNKKIDLNTENNQSRKDFTDLATGREIRNDYILDRGICNTERDSSND